MPGQSQVLDPTKILTTRSYKYAQIKEPVNIDTPTLYKSGDTYKTDFKIGF